jgi:hypothetical protein
MPLSMGNGLIVVFRFEWKESLLMKSFSQKGWMELGLKVDWLKG